MLVYHRSGLSKIIAKISRFVQLILYTLGLIRDDPTLSTSQSDLFSGRTARLIRLLLYSLHSSPLQLSSQRWPASVLTLHASEDLKSVGYN